MLAADIRGCPVLISAVDLAGGDDEKAQMPETTIMLLILSWKMGSVRFGEISKEVRTKMASPRLAKGRFRAAAFACCGRGLVRLTPSVRRALRRGWTRWGGILWSK